MRKPIPPVIEAHVRRRVAGEQIQASDVDDLLQVTRIRSWRRGELDTLGASSLRASMMVTAGRAVKDFWRRRIRRGEVEGLAAANAVVSTPSPEDEQIAVELARQALWAVSRLSVPHQLAFRAYYVDGKSVADIACDLGIPETRVRSLLDTAKNHAMRAAQAIELLEMPPSRDEEDLP